MVPFEAFSIDAPQSSMALCSGWLGGTQWDSLSSTVLSCADAPEARPSAIAASTATPIFMTSSLADARQPCFWKALLVMLHNDHAIVNATQENVSGVTKDRRMRDGRGRRAKHRASAAGPRSDVDLGPLTGLIGYMLRRAQIAVFRDIFRT